ncbi:neprilysin-11-like [Ornithodoros turicata]|uniref:neprilysin-11-like n=1 Tax=Ornithodoros turicata TaxID=34597 RepID=UPI003139D740
MAREHALSTKVLNYITFVSLVILLCFFINYPIVRWLRQIRVNHCLTSSCEKFTRDIRMSINRKAPPCQDFYKFACGHWERAHPGYSDQTDFTFEKIINGMISRLKKIRVPAQGQSAVQKAAAIFQACTSMINTESTNAEAMLRLLDKLNLNFPAGGSTVQLKALDVLVSLSLSYNIDLLFTLDLYEDYTGIYNLRLSVSAPILINYYLLTNGTTKQTMRQALKLIYGDLNFEAMIAVVLKFEDDVREAFLVLPPRRQMAEAIMIGNIGNYMPNYPGSEWVRAINNVLPQAKAITSSTVVWIEDVYILQTVSDLVLKLEDQMLLSWFVGWGVIRTLGMEASYPLGTALSNMEFVFSEKRCLASVRENLHFALVTPQVMTISGLSAKMSIMRLSVHIRRSFVEMIRQNHWMDEKTKSNAIRKAIYMMLLDGFPSFAEFPDKLNKYYAHIPDINADYMNVSITLREAKMNKMKRLLHTHISESDFNMWNFPLDSVHSLKYHNDLNKMIVPVAAASPPLFIKLFPTAWKFGGLATAIAEEMSHAFDVLGKNYNPFGSPSDWWTNKTQLRANTRSLCYLQDFGLWSNGAKGLTTVDQFRMLKAALTGVSRAFHAYSIYPHANDNRLRTLDYLSSNQIFFLSYCYRWCSKTSSTYAMNQHMCNFPLSYTKGFTDAFFCKKSDHMYYRRKCS